MVVTVTHGGYVKRVPLSTYRAQRRGGKGRAGMATRDEDFVSQVFVANTHTPVLFFSSTGMVYKLKVYKLPLGTPQARGKAMINLLPLRAGETITTLMPLPEDESRWGELTVVFATASGGVRRNALSDFTNVNANGKIAMKLDEATGSFASAPSPTTTTSCCSPARPVHPLRGRRGAVFSGRTSDRRARREARRRRRGVQHERLAHVEIEARCREEYLRAVNAKRRLAGSDYSERPEKRAEDEALAAKLELPEFREMAERRSSC